MEMNYIEGIIIIALVMLVVIESHLIIRDIKLLERQIDKFEEELDEKINEFSK